VHAAAAQALARPGERHEAMLADTRAWLAADERRHLITLGNPDYPTALLETADPPLMLHACGRLELLDRSSLAIVGSRNATVQGRDNARAFAAHLGNAGLAIASGLALGVDAAAHEGALQTPGGTIAVVATGLDQTYPRRHTALAQAIAEQGLLLSEYALGTPPLREHFPQRNRIIAGLTRGTLVVEATLQSGSLITARLAVEAGREVFAMPGSIHSPQAKGCHALIKQGAKLVETAQDVLDELGLAASPASAGAAPAGEPERPNPLLEALGHDPLGLDELVARTGWSAAELNARLLDLELAGQVERLPGQRFQRLARG
jgi:DNA processing protein